MSTDILAIVVTIIAGLLFIWLTVYLLQVIARALTRPISPGPRARQQNPPDEQGRRLPNPPAINPRSPYERVSTLLTTAERDFFAVLQQSTPVGHQIFAQVRLAGLVQVKPWARRDKSHWWRIQAKCLDFVLVDSSTLTPRLVVELDDRSHDRADRRERDAFVDDVLAGVGIPILHIRWQRRYDPAAVAHQLAAALGLNTPATPLVATPAALTDETPMPALLPAPIAAEAPRSDPRAPALVQLDPLGRLCAQCQAELRDSAKFCAQCGALCSAA